MVVTGEPAVEAAGAHQNGNHATQPNSGNPELAIPANEYSGGDVDEVVASE